MKIKTRYKFIFFSLLLILNIILRFQVNQHELGIDSFGIHILANSVSEFGYGKWIINPLSIFGLTPLSYASSVPFLISGIFQVAGINMEPTIFVYNQFIGLLSIFTAYLLATELNYENEEFGLFTIFLFSTCPAVLTYSTWTLTTRGLLVMLSPLMIYTLLKIRTSLKFVLLGFILALFLFATHHMFYFLLPSFLSFFVIYLAFKLNNITQYKLNLGSINPFIFIIGFFIMFSIPFFTGKFLEVSRYSPIYISYLRYIGILLPIGFSGLIYLTLKKNKTFSELFLLINIIFITMLIYSQTYMKWFIPVLFTPLIGISLINIANSKVKSRFILITIFLITSIIFSGYYQFLNEYDTGALDERYITDSNYITGKWMKNNLQGIGISNDQFLGSRIFSTTETLHQVTNSPTNNYIYNFSNVNSLEYEYNPVTSEEFFYSTGYVTEDIEQDLWYNINMMQENPQEFGINHIVENPKSGGSLIWTHKTLPSKILRKAYQEDDLIYDIGTIRVWKFT